MKRATLTMMNTCRCGVHDWRQLRLAMALTQAQMAEALYVSRDTVLRAEAVPHHCPRLGTIRRLRDILGLPLVQQRLRDAGYRMAPPAA